MVNGSRYYRALETVSISSALGLSSALPMPDSSPSHADGLKLPTIVAPKVWNTLPLKVRQISNTQTFKRNLKTFLFCTSYNIPTPTLSPAD